MSFVADTAVLRINMSIGLSMFSTTTNLTVNNRPTKWYKNLKFFLGKSQGMMFHLFNAHLKIWEKQQNIQYYEYESYSTTKYEII